MSPNIRACNNHTYTAYSSHSTTLYYTWSFLPSYTCSLGHSNCKFTDSENIRSVPYLSSVTQYTTTRTTSLVSPLNVRSKTHTHSYVRISVSQQYTNTPGYPVSCAAGHSTCVDAGSSSVGGDFSVSSSNTTITFTPAIPINIKQKLHQHTLPNTLLSWNTRYGYNTSTIAPCGKGHEDCRVYDTFSVSYLAVTTTSSTTSLN